MRSMTSKTVNRKFSNRPLDRIGYVLVDVLQAARAGDLSEERAETICDEVMAHVAKLNLASQKRLLDHIHNRWSMPPGKPT